MRQREDDSIEEIRVDDKVVTFASAFSDGTAVEVDIQIVIFIKIQNH